MPDGSRIRILTTCADDIVRRAAAVFHQSAAVETIRVDAIRRLEPAHCLVVDTTDHARTARATGFDGAIVLVGTPRSTDESEAFLLQGTHFAVPSGGAAALATALGTAIPLAADGSPNVVDPSVARMRRLLAAGELAVGLRHAFNNPLTALMAEIQLLQMEAHDEETRAATGRMLDLVRRLTELSRSMESVGDL